MLYSNLVHFNTFGTIHSYGTEKFVKYTLCHYGYTKNIFFKKYYIDSTLHSKTILVFFIVYVIKKQKSNKFSEGNWKISAHCDENSI